MQSLLDVSSTTLEDRLRLVLPTDVDHATIRLVDERAERLTVRQGTLEPVGNEFDLGVMVSVWDGGGLGYAATSDITEAGLRSAVEQARHWATVTAALAIDASPPPVEQSGRYASPVEVGWDTMDLRARIDLLHRQNDLMQIDERIVSCTASLVRRDVDTLLLASNGARIEQNFNFVYPALRATAAADGRAQSRSWGANAYCGQGGVEVLGRFGFGDSASRVANQALELLAAPNCPSGTMDVVLAPDQMILQIHESIGHPLELDRILGDERNYAGTSFVTPDMFGEFQYGSEHLNVTFDPTVPGQLASYGFDDEGTPARREYLIRNGVLERGLGGAVSQQRSGIPGVANARSCAWNRPPIDRMANLNIEPGDMAFDQMIGAIERGVYLETNNSWSIDDSRNKFQFSTEYGRLIEDGQLTTVIRNPSYRGISSSFWRNLRGVGNRDGWKAMGTPNCGKGELNQMIGTGHASPACWFGDIDVFGAED